MILAAALLLGVFVLPDGWLLPAVAIGAAIEIAETAFWIRFSRRGQPRMGPETHIGATAQVVEACRPIGRVRHQGEVWRARCDTGAEAGARVRVTAVEGLTLVVEPVIP